MVNNVNNNNLIPKTETVQELKSEIPSYEEFANSYDYDKSVANAYESEYQHQGLTGPQYGPGNTESKTKEGWKQVGGVALKSLTIMCPPAGLLVGAGVAGGAATYTIIGGFQNDREMMLDGLDVFEMGMGSAVGGAFGSGSHKARNCSLPICPKR